MENFVTLFAAFKVSNNRLNGPARSTFCECKSEWKKLFKLFYRTLWKSQCILGRWDFLLSRISNALKPRSTSPPYYYWLAAAVVAATAAAQEDMWCNVTIFPTSFISVLILASKPRADGSGRTESNLLSIEINEPPKRITWIGQLVGLASSLYKDLSGESAVME